MVKSSELDDPSFQIQERFTAINSTTCNRTSVSTGVAIIDTNIPTVQISTPRTGEASLNTVNTCPIDLYVGGVATSIGADGTTTVVATDVEVTTWFPSLSVYHPVSGVWINIRVDTSASFGCHFLVQVVMPENFRTNENVFGLLGTCNGDA